MLILVCNAGSTSLKFKLFDMPSEKIIARSNIERVGDKNGGLFRYFRNDFSFEETSVIPDYKSGILKFIGFLTDSRHGAVSDISEISAVGYKTVLSKNHYGVHFIDDETLQGMRDFMSVAPAHNSFYIEAINAFREILPETPMVGAFETAFHQTMPEEAFIYSAPYDWYEKYGVRRFGYHGASHSYIADCLNTELGNSYSAVSCHLGGSSSLCAIKDGKSIDTSFGMSLQCGVPQSNRVGDIDPYILRYLMDGCGMSSDEIFSDLTKNSGLKGISGISNDIRDLLAVSNKDRRAALAVSIYEREITRYIGGYAAIMGGLDAICFTAGIGENSAVIRNSIMKHFAFMGLEPSDSERAATYLPGEVHAKVLTTKQSKIQVYVIPANEELGVARKTYGKINE